METAFEHLLTAGFHGSLVILAILLLRPILRKGPKKFLCMLWLLALIRLILPFSFESSVSLQPEPLPLSQMLEKEAETLLQPAIQIQNALPESDPVQNVPQIAPARSPVSAESVLSRIWISVSSLFLLFGFYSYGRLRLSVRDAIRIQGAWESERIETAFLLGFIRPRIYLPMGMDPQTKAYILTHEQTHLEKGDQWLKLFGYMVLALHWFNPLVWAAYGLMCKDIELACDERVVQFLDLPQRKAYSTALLRCSANRIHLAACPVAFGEVSVRERIQAVLSYRRPAFWVSLFCVTVILFVMICLMTVPEKTDSESRELMSSETIRADLSESEILRICEQAVQDLVDRESCFLLEETYEDSDNPQYLSSTRQAEYRRHGQDFIYQTIPDEQNRISTGYLCREGRSASYNGGVWVWEKNSTVHPSQFLLSRYLPGRMSSVTFPSGTGVTEERTLSFYGCWTEPGDPSGQIFEGTLRYLFHPDGGLRKIQRESRELDAQGYEHRHQVSVTVLDESSQMTRNFINTAAASAISEGEEAHSALRQEQVSEIPSNTTPYDRDFAAGAVQNGWKLLNGNWYLKFGCVNATPISAELYYEYSGGDGISGTLETGDKFVLERMENGKWMELPLIRKGANSLEPLKITSETTVSLNWKESYGSLPAGFYRIGLYYNLDAGYNGRDTKFCYGKFRLFDSHDKRNLDICKTALSTLLNQEYLHLTNRSVYSDGFQKPPFVMEDHLWKHGGDYLNLTDSWYLNEAKTHRFTDGCGILNGSGYTLEFADNSFEHLKSCQPSEFISRENLGIWAFGYEIHDALITDILREGQKIIIRSRSTPGGSTSMTELIFRFDSSDLLQSLEKMTVTAAGETTTVGELTVYSDSSANISETIQNMLS